MAALSRPRHYAVFGAVLVALFLSVFSVTSAWVHSDPSDESALPAVGPKPEGGGAAVLALPLVPADLRIRGLANRECLNADPAQGQGGRLTVTLANDGAGDSGGFLLYVEVNVVNQHSGARQDYRVRHWEEDIRVGETRSFDVAYTYPIEEAQLVGPVAVSQPVPGSYRLTATVDVPTDPALAFLGEEGILPESDEGNNSAEVQSDGTADGLC